MLSEASPVPRNPSDPSPAPITSHQEETSPSPTHSGYSPSRHHSNVVIHNRPSQPNGGTDRYQDDMLVEARLKISGNDNPDLTYDTEYYEQYSVPRGEGGESINNNDPARYERKSMLPAGDKGAYVTQNQANNNKVTAGMSNGLVDGDRFKRTDVDRIRNSQRDVSYDTTTRLEFANPSTKSGSIVIPKKA